MVAIVLIAFAAHVIAWIVLPNGGTEQVRESVPALGSSVATA